MGEITRGADNLFRIKGPTQKSDGTPLDFTNAAATSLFRLYNKRKQHTIAAAQTRLRTANLSTATFLIPHLVPQWLFAGDELLVETDDGEVDRVAVLTITPGTGPETPATNFDTMVTTFAVNGDCSAGNKLVLERKAAFSRNIPIGGATSPVIVDDEVEIQRDNLATFTGIPLQVWAGVEATEDGRRAANHPDGPAMILLAADLGSVATVGRRVRVKLGGDVSMTEFPPGGAVAYPDATAWKASGGFEGVIADTEASLSIGDLVEIEVHFNGGSGLFLLDRISETVI